MDLHLIIHSDTAMHHRASVHATGLRTTACSEGVVLQVTQLGKAILSSFHLCQD